MKTLLYFTSPTCLPCRAFGPVVESVAKTCGVELERIDVTRATATANRYHITSVPALVLLDGYRILGQRFGACSDAALLEWVLG